MVNKMNSSKAVLCMADAHGLSGFDIAPDQYFAAKLRADNSRQRHTIVFKVELNSAQKKEIRRLIKEKDCVGALKYLKDCVTQVAFPSGSESYRRSFALIPNPDLDPFNAP